MPRVKYDANHREIVDTYRNLGCSVADTARAGLGVPDLFVGCMGISDPVEIKTEDGRLLPSQETFKATWRGSPVAVVRTAGEVSEHVAQMRRRAIAIAKTKMIGPERE